MQHEMFVFSYRKAYDWKGVCDRLPSTGKSTLVIVGTDDIVRPPANSLMLAEKIPGAWLVQIKGGGHGGDVAVPRTIYSGVRNFSFNNLISYSDHRFGF